MTAEDIVNIMEEVRDSESNEYDKTGDLYDRATLLQIANALHGVYSKSISCDPPYPLIHVEDVKSLRPSQLELE